QGDSQKEVEAGHGQEQGNGKGCQSETLVHEKMADTGPELVQKITGLGIAIGKFTQHALVLLPSKIKRHKGEKEGNAQYDQKTAQNDFVLLGRSQGNLLFGRGGRGF